MAILAGDLGGTKTLLGIYDDSGKRLHGQRFENAGRASLEEIVVAFLADTETLARAPEPPRRAVFGVAGPVEEIGPARQRARITNLPWALDSEELRAAAGLSGLRLVNDFYAAAAATTAWAKTLEGGAMPDSVVALNPPAKAQPRGALAVLGAGTGLGEAIVARTTHAPLILPSEGGHSDFAPQDEIEVALLRFLQARHGGHVSCERVLCGAGLLSLYEFYRGLGGLAESPAVRAEIEQDRGRAPATISRHGLAGDDPICATALDRFSRIYGAEAGNLALKCLATGGVYVTGGIAPKILGKLQDGSFMQGFASKGRFSALCQSIPVYVVVHPEAGLYGAAVLAL